MGIMFGVVLSPECLKLLLYEGEGLRLLRNSPLPKHFPLNHVLENSHMLEFVWCSSLHQLQI